MNHTYIDTRFKADRPLREPTTLRGVLPALVMVAVGAAAVLIWSDDLPGTRDEAVASAKPLSMTVPLWLAPEPPAASHRAAPLTSTVALPENPENWSDELPQTNKGAVASSQPLSLTVPLRLTPEPATTTATAVPSASTVVFPENSDEPVATF